jgi:gamma-glutamyltranspeptidase/glutathione hydrolase
MKLRIWLFLIMGALATACLAPTPQSEPPRLPHTAAVAMPDAFSAEVSGEVLRIGGNAVDAAVAAAFALAVTYPEAGNIGGGGFMLLYVDGQALFLDYRETAPAAAHRDMYLDDDGLVIEDRSLVGHRAVGVPGTVAGMWAAHYQYGLLTWEDVLAPAIHLAENGFIAPPLLAQRIRKASDRFFGRTGFDAFFGKVQAGGLIRQPELARTLRRIAAEGPDGFYSGATAGLILAEMRRGSGLITADDLSDYKVVWREPLRAYWREYEILTAPPPSSGGIGLIQLLKMKDYLAEEFSGLAHNSTRYVHLVAEIEKRVFADRADYLGDPDFVPQPVSELIDNDYLFGRAAQVNPNRISELKSVQPGLESHDTTHFSIVDRHGNAVANTYSLNSNFGSGVIVNGGGFLLNNQMDDFSAKPGASNLYGLVGNNANAIQPGKRMLSSMTPTMLMLDEQVQMVIGTPGGSTIFTSVFQTIVNLIDFDMPLPDALAASRFHHQLLPRDLVTYSPSRPLPAATQSELVRLGYRVEPHEWEFGDLQVIWYQGDNYRAASDPRFRGVSRVMPW